MIISLIGMPGCGKTTIGKELVKKLNMKFIDIDEFIEKNYDSIEHLFKISEQHFRNIEHEALIKCIKNDNSIISTGGGIILSEENVKILREKSIVFFINRNVDDIIKSANLENRPLLKNNEKAIYRLYEERIDKYYACAHHIINSNNVLNDTIDKIMKILLK